MTDFIIIDAEREMVRQFKGQFSDAVIAAGLPPDQVDHGTISEGIALVVFEHGMFQDPESQHYIVLNNKLYAGNVLLYGFDESGETIDLHQRDFDKLSYSFLHGYVEVEYAISIKLCERPEMRVDHHLIWQWPDPMPFNRP